jgi:hypothetical protein
VDGPAGNKGKISGHPRHHWGRFLNVNAHGAREGYSLSNADHLRKVDDQFRACVAAIKGVTASPLTPSWIDASSGKGARLDHLVGLGVEFTCASGAAACSQTGHVKRKDQTCGQTSVAPKADTQTMARNKPPNRRLPEEASQPKPGAPQRWGGGRGPRQKKDD